MKGELLSSMEAAAYGAKLAGVEKVPDYPAPFSADITKSLSKIHKCDIYEAESVSTAFASALGAAAAGKRAFLPVSSPLSTETFTAPFMCLPFVVVNVSRSLHGVRSDHAAVMALRDAGYLMFFPENNQEIYDSIILAYKVCEDSKVMLPAIINIDGIHNFSEPVLTATDQSAKGFLSGLPKRLDVKKPMNLDVYQENYDELKLQQTKAMEFALEVLAKTNEKWKQKFHREFTPTESFMIEDAETVIVTMGYHSSTAKAAAKTMRSAGKKVGVLRIRVFRPWPKNEVDNALAKAKKILVFDQAISTGIGGILTAHIKRGSSLISLGKYPSEKNFVEAVEKIEKSDKDLKLWL